MSRQRAAVVTRAVILTLDWPPSVNTYWRTWRGRMLLSAKGREYQQHVMGCCLEAGVKRLDGRLAVSIIAYPPDSRKRDLDNLLKPILDGLCHGGVYEDDSQVDSITIERGKRREGGEVLVQVEAITQP